MTTECILATSIPNLIRVKSAESAPTTGPQQLAQEAHFTYAALAFVTDACRTRINFTHFVMASLRLDELSLASPVFIA